MNDRFFVLIYGTSIKGKDFTHFSSYHNVQDVVDLAVSYTHLTLPTT